MGFCPNCSKEIPDSSKFCPYCSFRLGAGTASNPPQTSVGRPENSRSNEYLTMIPNVIASEPAGTYELYVADHRFVLLKTQPRTGSWATGGGLLGAAIAAGADRARRKIYDPNAPLDTKIGLDKHNYILPYNKIQRIALNKGMFGGGKEVEVHYEDEEGKTRKVKYNLGKNASQFGRALSEVASLVGKVDQSVPGYSRSTPA